MVSSRNIRVEMLNRLAQPDSTLARNAADVLGEFHYVSSIPALAAALSNPVFSSEARAHMAQALGRISRPAVVAPLTSVLGGSDGVVKVAAMQALQSIAGLRDGSAVAPLLGDSDVGVRAEAATTLGMFHDANGTAPLVNALQNDASPVVRKRAAWALGEIQPARPWRDRRSERRCQRREPLRSLAGRGCADQAVSLGRGSASQPARSQSKHGASQ